jgi:hypothetical protein
LMISSSSSSDCYSHCRHRTLSMMPSSSAKFVFNEPLKWFVNYGTSRKYFKLKTWTGQVGFNIPSFLFLLPTLPLLPTLSLLPTSAVLVSVAHGVVPLCSFCRWLLICFFDCVFFQC